MTGEFNDSDRRLLVKLSVDMGYMKTGLDELRVENRSREVDTKAEIKTIWMAIEDLRRFRWWIAGSVCGASLTGGAVVKLLLK
jgi:hypothetical protein